MDLKIALATFVTVFLAELGDKTQLATFGFAAENPSRLSVFLGAAGALVVTSLLAVLGGAFVGRIVPPNVIRMGAGALFVVLGLWMLLFSGGK